MPQFGSTERFDLLEGQIQLLHDLFERNVEARVTQNVVYAVHDEVFQSLFVLIALFFTQVSQLKVPVLLARSSECVVDLRVAIDPEVLQIVEDLEPGFHPLLTVEVIGLANAARFAQDSVEFDDGVGHKACMLLGSCN